MKLDAPRPTPRIALVSIGIGRTQRGFERYFSDLFGVLLDELDVTLFKSAGACNSHEKIPLLLWPTTMIARLLPLGRVAEGAEYRYYKHDCLAYGLSLLPDLLLNRFDLIHVIDYPLAIVLGHLQRIFRFRTKLLFTNGCCMPPQYYPRSVHVHHVAPAFFQDALAMGIPKPHISLVPVGIHTRRFETTEDRQALRKKYAIPDSTFVVLAVTAVKRIHKRVDYLIEEVSRIDGDVLLWIDGNPEDPDIPELARRKLGSRCRITHVPSSDVPELYRLADVLVHAALEEAFGLAVVEAFSTGLMVLTHASPHFEWLVQDRDCLVDMRVPGNLAARLRELLGQSGDISSRAQARAASVRQRFEWFSLTQAYVEMYRKVAASDLSTTVGESKIACEPLPHQDTGRVSAGPHSARRLAR